MLNNVVLIVRMCNLHSRGPQLCMLLETRAWRPDLHFATCALQVTALKNLNLNIRKAKLGGKGQTFYITEADTSEKIVKSARLEEIRMTVLQSLAETFPVGALRTTMHGMHGCCGTCSACSACRKPVPEYFMVLCDGMCRRAHRPWAPPPGPPIRMPPSPWASVAAAWCRPSSMCLRRPTAQPLCCASPPGTGRQQACCSRHGSSLSQ